MGTVPNTGAPAVELRELSVRRDAVTLLPTVSLSVRAGEAVAVTGENGTGKTTLLRVVAGLVAATSGRAEVQGRSVDERDPAFRRAVAGLIGVPPVARDLTLREHLALVAVSWGASIPGGTGSAEALLDEAGLLELADRFPHELSSGQSQLFSVLLVLARPADILLVDEPEQRLDAARLTLVGDLLRARVDAGATLLIASHSPALIAAVCDRSVPLARSG